MGGMIKLESMTFCLEVRGSGLFASRARRRTASRSLVHRGWEPPTPPGRVPNLT